MATVNGPEPTALCHAENVILLPELRLEKQITTQL